MEEENTPALAARFMRRKKTASRGDHRHGMRGADEQDGDERLAKK